MRVIVDDNGEVIERNDFYPFGLRWNNDAAPIADNRYRYNAKEEQAFLALPYIDYGARMYDPKYNIRWNSVDPLAEKYLYLSPFAFCAGNPIRFVDPNGEDIWELDNKGNIVSHRKYDELDAFYMVENVDGAWQRTGVELVFKPGTEISSKTYTYSPDNITVSSYDVYKVRGDDVGNTLFKFLADNITGSPSSVEIGQIMTGIEGDKGLHFITTSHTKDKEASIKNLINGQVGYGYTVREVNHSHSVELSPSWSDIKFAVELICEYKEVGRRAPQFHIYHVPTRQKVPFSP